MLKENTELGRILCQSRFYSSAWSGVLNKGDIFKGVMCQGKLTGHGVVPRTSNNGTVSRGDPDRTQRDRCRKWLPAICRAMTFQRETQSIHGDPAEREQEMNILTLMSSTHLLISWGASH